MHSFKGRESQQCGFLTRLLHSSREAVERAAVQIEQWLNDMGLHLNPKKTRLTHTLTPVGGQVGFDFLGFNVRQYPVGKTHRRMLSNRWSKKVIGFKTRIKPGKEETKRHIREIKQRLRKMGHRSQAEVISALNPVIRGWADYYQTVVSSRVFSYCDKVLYTQLLRWAKGKHRARGKQWIHQKYWHTIGNQRWVFAYKTPEEVKKIRTHSMTHIQRFVKVRGTASPYDGNLLYWYKRLKKHPLMEQEKAKLLHLQKGQCPRCRLYFREEDHLQTDHITPTALGGRDDLSNKWVYHKHCHDEKTALDLAKIAEYKAAGISHKGPYTEEPDDWRQSRPVLEQWQGE